MLSAQSAFDALSSSRQSVRANLESVRTNFQISLVQVDRAIAETSRPTQKGRPRRINGRQFDFCDRDVWYLHVRFARRHDPAALEQLVQHYRTDAERQARRIGARSSSEDLVQVANEALVVALHRFDPRRRKPFPPFARLTVDGTLRRYLRDQGYAIRPTRRIYELTPRLRQTTDWLTQEFGRAPTAAELADALDVSTEEVLEALASTETRSPLSLDRPVGEEGSTLADLAGQPDANLAHALDRYAVKQLMRGLPVEDRMLLDQYFLQGNTQQEIADARGVSQMHVSRALARVLRRLRTRAATT